jgi:hypothetical protein
MNLILKQFSWFECQNERISNNILCMERIHAAIDDYLDL